MLNELLFWWKTSGSFSLVDSSGRSSDVALFHVNVNVCSLVRLLPVRPGRGFLECICEGLSHT